LSQFLIDFVVGAPFVGGGVGAVFVYLGSDEKKLVQSKKILGSEFHPINILGFGFSFSRAVDIDANNYRGLRNLIIPCKAAKLR
jgi:hypothetical protein